MSNLKLWHGPEVQTTVITDAMRHTWRDCQMRSWAIEKWERVSWCAKFYWITKCPCLELIFIDDRLSRTKDSLTKTRDQPDIKANFLEAASVKHNGAMRRKARPHKHSQDSTDILQCFKRLLVHCLMQSCNNVIKCEFCKLKISSTVLTQDNNCLLFLS